MSFSPDNLWLRYNRVAVLSDEGRTTEAETAMATLLTQPIPGPACRANFKTLQISLLLRQRQFERVRELTEEFLRAEPSALVQLYVLDSLACAPFMNEVPGYLDEALRWCGRALEIQPGNLTLTGTKGTLLAEQGRWDEAAPLLRHVAASSEADMDQGICAGYLALLAQREGRLEEARQLARRSRQLYSQPWLTRRLDAVLPQDSEASAAK